MDQCLTFFEIVSSNESGYIVTRDPRSVVKKIWNLSAKNVADNLLFLHIFKEISCFTGVGQNKRNRENIWILNFQEMEFSNEKCLF